MSAHQAFARSVAQLWARDGIAGEEAASLADSVTAAFALGGASVRVASEMLSRSGVRDKWNDVLRHDRAAALAAKIAPFATGPVLDVLSGDGSVCRALAELGVTGLAATERIGGYAESVLPPSVPFVPFSDDLDLGQFHARTAVISAVLHHEADPVRLLDSVARANIPRWVVIENCVTAECSRDFHQFADMFFNNCLNDFDVHCGDEHRALDEWTDLLSRYGNVEIVEDFFSAPGIPFPYSLLVVTTQC